MGAVPGEAYVQLGVPDDLDQEGCLELGEGLAQVAAEHDVAVLGGDVTRAPVLWVAITGGRPRRLGRAAGAARWRRLRPAALRHRRARGRGGRVFDPGSSRKLADVVGAEAADLLRGRQLEPRPPNRRRPRPRRNRGKRHDRPERRPRRRRKSARSGEWRPAFDRAGESPCRWQAGGTRGGGCRGARPLPTLPSGRGEDSRAPGRAAGRAPRSARLSRSRRAARR